MRRCWSRGPGRSRSRERDAGWTLGVRGLRIEACGVRPARIGGVPKVHLLAGGTEIDLVIIPTQQLQPLAAACRRWRAPPARAGATGPARLGGGDPPGLPVSPRIAPLGGAFSSSGGGGAGSGYSTPSPTSFASGNSGAGGSGVIILAVPTPAYPGSAPGATVTTPPAAPGMTVITYTSSGTYTA